MYSEARNQTNDRLQLTVAILKEFLHGHGRATAGKKADLVDRVEQYFEQKF
jgi:ATP-dependent DNA helicase 2 subunit 1